MSPDGPAYGFLVIVVFLAGAMFVTLFDVLCLDDFARVVWAWSQFVGRAMVLIITLFQVWLPDRYNLRAGVLGIVVQTLLLAGAIKLLIPIVVDHPATPALLSRLDP